ncbi:peptidoglycan-binding domain-containing protein [Streptomyces sp. SP18CS02]|uniref:peptidoglycan-binding domain-containing protein n=1 Tax=Streptomyces sp. SP18CS02 TaxID=3002531 RepID=UPI002E76B2CB|nr:peptidoglycan-binding domain-containing protein [Streptomyces sp. SP18CS02]MEE1754466.1 peptidoglycan-binding domain-containing protein [Streptomyces sp. SP18CS02]
MRVARARSRGRRRPPKRRRQAPLTAAVATLVGSAAIAGGYALSGSGDTEAAKGAPSASLLAVVEGPSTPPAPGRTSPPPPAKARTTPSSRHGLDSRAPALSATATSSASAPARTAVAPAPASPAASAQGPTLRRHDQGPEVAELQERLARVGMWPYPQREHYNRRLQKAVHRFQRTHDVDEDPPGVYGPATRRLLESLTP